MNYGQLGAQQAIANDQYLAKAYAAAQQPGAETKQRESEATFNQIAEQLQRMGNQLERLRDITNRTLGPRPEPVSTQGHSVPAGIPQALSGRLNLIFDALNVANQRLSDDLGRLDSFV